MWNFQRKFSDLIHKVVEKAVAVQRVVIHLVHPLEIFVVAAQNAALFDVEETQLLDLGSENFPESRHHVRLRGFLRVHILLQLAYILALRGI